MCATSFGKYCGASCNTLGSQHGLENVNMLTVCYPAGRNSRVSKNVAPCMTEMAATCNGVLPHTAWHP